MSDHQRKEELKIAQIAVRYVRYGGHDRAYRIEPTEKGKR